MKFFVRLQTQAKYPNPNVWHIVAEYSCSCNQSWFVMEAREHTALICSRKDTNKTELSKIFNSLQHKKSLSYYHRKFVGEKNVWNVLEASNKRNIDHTTEECSRNNKTSTLQSTLQRPRSFTTYRFLITLNNTIHFNFFLCNTYRHY